MPRSLKKGPFVDDHLIKKVAATPPGGFGGALFAPPMNRASRFPRIAR